MVPVPLLILSVILTGDDGNDGDTDAKEENAGGDSGEDADGDCW